MSIEVDAKLAARLGVASGEEWLSSAARHTEGSHILPGLRWTEVISRICRLGPPPAASLPAPSSIWIEDLFGQSYRRGPSGNRRGIDFTGAGRGLKVKAGTTALEVRRTYKLATGKIAQVAINTHPAARFCYAMTMRRVKDSLTNRRLKAVNGWYVLAQPSPNRRCFRPKSDYIIVSAAAAAKILMLVTRPVRSRRAVAVSGFVAMTGSNRIDHIRITSHLRAGCRA